MPIRAVRAAGPRVLLLRRDIGLVPVSLQTYPMHSGVVMLWSGPSFKLRGRCQVGLGSPSAVQLKQTVISYHPPGLVTYETERVKVGPMPGGL